jgi:signal transduction histidine kinase
MQTLRIKVALILIAAIVAVGLVATGVTALVVSSGDAARLVNMMSGQIANTTDLLRDTGERPPGPQPGPRGRERIADTAAPGSLLPDLTTALNGALAQEGFQGTVIVTANPNGGEPRASHQLADGRWIIFDFPRPIPVSPSLWLALVSWLTLVVIGVVVVALVMAQRATRPFVIVEQAIASVGMDGVLPHMPEIGSGEARQMAASLNRLSDRLKASMESRMRLVAAAGHDFRTPMTRMRLRAEFLDDEERASWIADLDELEAIADSAIRLVREESAGEDRQSVSVDTLVRETVDELSAARLPVALTAAAPATVNAGPLSLKRALRNLITNAATHGQGARVAVAVEGENARIDIEDDGPGIPEDLMSRVFEPFFRAAPGRMRQSKGAGLGLAIAKEIIERFGGSIAIANRPEGGLRQTVNLRLAT